MRSPFASMSSTFAFLWGATLLAVPCADGEVVHFGNYAPGTEIKYNLPEDGGGGQSGGDASLSTGIYKEVRSAVSFTTGSQEIQITSVDLALLTHDAGTGSFQLRVTSADLPSFGSTLVSFSTLQTVTETAGRISFTSDTPVTLFANTTYYLQLQWNDGSGSYRWLNVVNASPILSTYSQYVLTYSDYSSQSVDGGGYYITATVVPEPGALGFAVGGVVLTGLLVRVWRRKGGAAGEV